MDRTDRGQRTVSSQTAACNCWTAQQVEPRAGAETMAVAVAEAGRVQSVWLFGSSVSVEDMLKYAACHDKVCRVCAGCLRPVAERGCNRAQLVMKAVPTRFIATGKKKQKYALDN